jgi:hypothetical protein
MHNYFPIYEEAVSHILLCNCPLWISLYMRRIFFSFLTMSFVLTNCSQYMQKWLKIPPSGRRTHPNVSLSHSVCVSADGNGGRGRMSRGESFSVYVWQRRYCEHNSPIATPHKTATHHISKWKDNLFCTALWFNLHSSQVSPAVFWQKRRYSSDLVKCNQRFEPKLTATGDFQQRTRSDIGHTWFLIWQFKIACFLGLISYLAAVPEDAGIWTQVCLPFALRVRGPNYRLNLIYRTEDAVNEIS